VTLVGFRGNDHPQQVGTRGALDVVDDRGTPPEIFDPLHEEFGFTLDVAAAPHNAKCERFYTLQDDALHLPWEGRVWCNPPYSNLDKWVFKARWEFLTAKRAEIVVMLLPANRCEQKWWQTQIEPYRDDRRNAELTTRFLPGRPRFIMPGFDKVEPNQRPPFGLVLAIWRFPS
jgi:phage N-6-adenine-methyltransferase